MGMDHVEGPDNGAPLVPVPAQVGIWQAYEKALAPPSRSFRVLAVEVRGHGRSSWAPGGCAWNSVGGDAAELVEGVVRGPAIASGNSSGGIMGLWCASRAARRARALVLGDAPAFCVEMPRFEGRGRFTCEGLERLVGAIGDVGGRGLADYLGGQVMPVSDARAKGVPDRFAAFVSREPG